LRVSGPVLAASIVACASVAGAVREQRITLEPGWTGEHAWWIFPTPAPLAGLPQAQMTHFRLLAPEGTAFWLNGAALTRSPDGEIDIGGHLRWTGARRNLLVASRAVPATLSLTTRVFLPRVDLHVNDEQLTGRVWIRNTLENTANVFVTIRSDRVLFDAPTNVPPGVTQPVEVRAPYAGPVPASLECILDKHEEAVEPGYQYIQGVRVGRGGQPPF